jgi:hypothetical protein
MDVRIRIPEEILRDPEIARRVRDFRREERLRHALLAGGAAVAALACLASGLLLWLPAAVYAASAACWSVRLERMLTRGMYESFHTLERAVWARVGRLRVRERDVEALRACADTHDRGRRATLQQLYEIAHARRGESAEADAEFREVADAVYRFLVVHRFAVTDAMLAELLPRVVVVLAVLALLGGGAAAIWGMW